MKRSVLYIRLQALTLFSAELKTRLKFVLAANMPIPKAILRSTEVLKILHARNDNSVQFLGVSLANYFIKGDFLRVILQEALGSEQLDGFLRFLHMLDDVWQEMDDAKPRPNRVILGDQVTPSQLLHETLSDICHNVYLQVRDQGLVGDDTPGRKRVRSFFSGLRTVDPANESSIKSYLRHQITQHEGKSTLAYDGSNILANASAEAINGQIYMQKLIK